MLFRKMISRVDVTIREGEILQFAEPLDFKVGDKLISSYDIGDQITVLQRTNKNPHNYPAPNGNWIVQSKYGISVWTSLATLKDHGILVSIE